MLEFIVLGHIPGTTIYITFAQVLIASSILLIASEIRILIQRKNVLRTAQAWINQISL